MTVLCVEETIVSNALLIDRESVNLYHLVEIFLLIFSQLYFLINKSVKVGRCLLKSNFSLFGFSQLA